MSTLSRQHYVMLAAALREVQPEKDFFAEDPTWVQYEAAKNQYDLTVHAIKRALHRDNSRFDEGRFLEACGL